MNKSSKVVIPPTNLSNLLQAFRCARLSDFFYIGVSLAGALLPVSSATPSTEL